MKRWNIIIAAAILAAGLVQIAVPGLAQERTLPFGIRVFLDEVSNGKSSTRDGLPYAGPGIEGKTLKTLGGLLDGYKFKVKKVYVVAYDAMLKLEARDHKVAMILTIRLGDIEGNWRLLQNPVMREIRLPDDGNGSDDAGRLKKELNRLRIELIIEESMVDGVEDYLIEMKGKYSPPEDSGKAAQGPVSQLE